jgi:tetratricopeptide (TPR) repeat protein
LARRLDPLSPAAGVWSAAVILYGDEPEEGAAALEKQVALSPRFWMAHHFLSQAVEMKGRFAEAKVEAERAVELSGGATVALSQLAGLYYRLGDRVHGDALLTQLEERGRKGYVSPMLLAMVFLTRGEADEALRRVEAAVAGKDPWASTYCLTARRLGHSEPRIESLIERPSS